MKFFIFFFILYSFFALTSCSLQSKEKKIELEKQALTDHLQEKIQEQKDKFDKSKSREKVEGFTGFLCTSELLTHSGTNIEIETKNCMQEKKDDSIKYFIEGNIVYKDENGKKSEAIKIHTNTEKLTAAKFIKNNIIGQFSNNLEKINCNPILNKTLKIENKDFKYIYNISTFGFYKHEAQSQIEKNPKTKVCEGYYNPLKGFILTTNKGDILLEFIKKDELINLNNIKIKVQ